MTHSWTDAFYMAKVLKLASKGFYTVRSNPMVACVIVKNDKIIAKGYHQKAGMPHAEQIAIQKVLKKGYNPKDLEDATLYVNLEPCNHFGKTPPCAEAILLSGIKRVVIGSIDPNPKMRGKSIEFLRQKGIECRFGIHENECKSLNAAHFKRFENKHDSLIPPLPYGHLKIACNLEGYMDDGTEARVIISDQKSRDDSQKIRAKSGAIITTAKTVMIDNPRMTVHNEKITQKPYFVHPLRVILDSKLKTINDNKYIIYNDLKTKVIVYHNINNLSEEEIEQKQSKLKNQVEFRYAPADETGLKLPYILNDLLTKNEVIEVMFETGCTLSTSILKQSLADEITIYLADTKLANTLIPTTGLTNTNLKSIFPALDAVLSQYQIRSIKKLAGNIKLNYLRKSLTTAKEPQTLRQ